MQSHKHPVDEVLPLGRLTALGLQHVLVMYSAAVIVPILLASALNLSNSDLAFLILLNKYDFSFVRKFRRISIIRMIKRFNFFNRRNLVFGHKTHHFTTRHFR